MLTVSLCRDLSRAISPPVRENLTLLVHGGQHFGAKKGSKDQVAGEEDDEDWGQCIIKVVGRPKEGAGLGDKKAEYLKVSIFAFRVVRENSSNSQ